MYDTVAYSQRYCPVCGKSFCFSCSEDEWGYAYGSKLVCSYPCMRQMEREDTNQPHYTHPGAMLYKRLMLGKTYAEIIDSGTARQNGLDTPEKVREFVDVWVKCNPYDAKRLKETAQYQLTHVKRADIARMTGVRNARVRDYGYSIGIYGRMCCGNIYYTPQEADRLIRELTA